MSRRKQESPISLFSFQDIIMSVVGIVILISLLLLLKLITQAPQKESATTISAQELQEQIESLRPVLQEIQDEMTKLEQIKTQSEIPAQMQEKINAIKSAVKILEAEIIERENELEKLKQYAGNLKNDPKSKLLPENENRIKQMKEQLEQLTKNINKLSAQEKELQIQLTELAAKDKILEERIATKIPLQLKVSVQKKSDKTAIICIYGEEDGLTAIPTNNTPQARFTTKSAFAAWMDMRNKEREYFVIYFRPSRFGQYEEFLDSIKNKGFEVGFQVIGEKTNLVIDH